MTIQKARNNFNPREVFISNEQLSTWLKYGNRTGIVKEFEYSQEYKCPSKECNFQFILDFNDEREL